MGWAMVPPDLSCREPNYQGTLAFRYEIVKSAKLLLWTYLNQSGFNKVLL